MANVGMVFNPVLPHVEGPVLPLRARSRAGLLSREELGAPMRRPAAQVGLGHAERWIALTDGGSGLEHRSETNFPGAVRILDFGHAAEYLSALAKALHPGRRSRRRP